MAVCSNIAMMSMVAGLDQQLLLADDDEDSLLEQDPRDVRILQCTPLTFDDDDDDDDELSSAGPLPTPLGSNSPNRNPKFDMMKRMGIARGNSTLLLSQKHKYRQEQDDHDAQQQMHVEIDPATHVPLDQVLLDRVLQQQSTKQTNDGSMEVDPSTFAAQHVHAQEIDHDLYRQLLHGGDVNNSGYLKKDTSISSPTKSRRRASRLFPFRNYKTSSANNKLEDAVAAALADQEANASLNGSVPKQKRAPIYQQTSTPAENSASPRSVTIPPPLITPTTTSSTQKKKKSLWKSAIDVKTGRKYYYHRKTRETTWEQPHGLIVEARTRHAPLDPAAGRCQPTANVEVLLEI